MLKEIRIHGRGGQGAVTLAELIAVTAFFDGKKVQAFPSFGVERRGAPVESYVRISAKKVLRYDEILNPDFLFILDETLLKENFVFKGLDKGDIVLINSKKTAEEERGYFKTYPDITVYTLDATSLGLEVLGKPIANTAMVGAFSATTGLISFESIKKAIGEKFDQDLVEKNILLAKKAFDFIGSKSKNVIVSEGREVVLYNQENIRISP